MKKLILVILTCAFLSSFCFAGEQLSAEQKCKKIYGNSLSGKNLQNCIDSMNLQNRLAKDTQSRVVLMNNLKTCKRSGIKTLEGNQYVLGSRNGNCYYRVDLPKGSSYFQCAFPMSVARKFAEAMLEDLLYDKKSIYIFETLGSDYCKEYKK